MTATTTGTTAGAREHARAQEADAVGTVATMPTRPARSFPTPPSEVDPATLVHAEVVAGGGYTHLAVARGTHVRLTDLVGDACAHVLPTGGPPVGAAQRRRHGQGPVAGLPDRGPPAALRPGPGARDHRRRHVRPARRAVRDVDAGAQRRAVRRRQRAGPDARRPRAVHAGGGQARPGPTRPSAEHLVLPGRADRRRRAPACSRGRPAPAPRSRCAPRCRCCCSSPTPRTRSTRASTPARRWRCSAWRGHADARRPTRCGTPRRRAAAPSSTPPTDLTARGIA